MPGSEYTAAPPTGKLKLKGVADARVDKKKKRKRPKTETENHADKAADDNFEDQDRSVVLKHLADEDGRDGEIPRASGEHESGSESRSRAGAAKSQLEAEAGETLEMEPVSVSKTAAEMRFEEQRRKRLEERLKREGVKTHKQRVEELNRYLSGLSEHHDMPKIGPG